MDTGVQVNATYDRDIPAHVALAELRGFVGHLDSLCWVVSTDGLAD
jgi:hypothetical protein